MSSVHSVTYVSVAQSQTDAPNHIERFGQVTRDRIGRNSQHAVAKLLQILIAFGVELALICMDFAVDLDDDAALETEKVDDIWPDGVLASEAPAAELSPP